MATPLTCRSISSQAELKMAFVGKKLQDVPAPSVIIDRSVVERNCRQMLESCQALKLDFRPHIKTHKTIEVTRLQLGEAANEAKVIVSTIAEAEHVLQYLSIAKSKGKKPNILYGIPLAPSHIPRLARIAKILGPGSISVLIDHPDQLSAAPAFLKSCDFPLQVFIKVDTGYHRAGLKRGSDAFESIIHTLFSLERNQTIEFVGFYSHSGHSYGVDSGKSAIVSLIEEIVSLKQAADGALASCRRTACDRPVLSVGATPTATSMQAALLSGEDLSEEMVTLLRNLKETISNVQQDFVLEIHAGVYPFLDMQQLATQASPSATSDRSHKPLSTNDIAVTVLTEVCSLYPHRNPPEALIAAGTLALGRELCKSYPGWGVVSDWSMATGSQHWENRSGWQVGKISQEHGILTHDPDAAGGGKEEPDPLIIGQKVRVWPNHACVAGAGFDWYLVVDSELEGKEDEVVDVWVRCRGW